jgi:hypothetical protein
MFRIIVIYLMVTILMTAGLSSCKMCTHKPTSSGQCGVKEKMEAEAKSVTVDFGKYAVGTLPEGFLTAVTNGGAPGKWEIVDAGGKKVFAQTNTDETDGRFPLCVYDKVSLKDVEVSVDFMAVSGKLDQAAGVVARYKDKDNYYITRANAIEDNVRLYKVEEGNRKQIASVNLKVTPGKWHTLKLEVEGTHLKVYYDGKSVIGANDATFQNTGKTGLWTKADSVTYFNNLNIKAEE